MARDLDIALLKVETGPLTAGLLVSGDLEIAKKILKAIPINRGMKK